MKDLTREITVEQANKAYLEKGICCIGNEGKIEYEFECEDYCEE